MRSSMRSSTGRSTHALRDRSGRRCDGRSSSYTRAVLPTAADTAPEAPSGSDVTRPAPPGDTGPRRAGSRSAKWALGGLAVAGLAYVAAVDPNQPNLVPACAFKALTGLDCPGCGGTRAVHALLHGDVGNALNHNVLVTAVVAIGLVWVLANLVRRRLGRPPLRFSLTLPWAIALMAVIAAFWIVRNLPWSPLSWLGSGN